MTKAIVSVPARALRFKLGRTVRGSGLSESTTGFLFVSFVYLNCKDMGTTARGYGKATHGASIKPHRAHANNAAQLSTGSAGKPWQHAARGLTGCQCQWMEYLGPVDSSSLPVRLRWKLCRAALHHLPPPSPLPPAGFLVCFASQKKKQTKIFSPPSFLLLLLSPFPVFVTANGGSHAHQGPG